MDRFKKIRALLGQAKGPSNPAFNDRPNQYNWELHGSFYRIQLQSNSMILYVFAYEKSNSSKKIM